MLSEWIRALNDSVSEQKPLSSHLRRVLSPGAAPLDGKGLIMFEPKGAIDRVGMPQEAISVIRWASESQPEGFPLSDLPMQFGAMLTLAADRRIEVLDEQWIGMEGSDTKICLPIHPVVDRRLISPPVNEDLVRDFADLLAKVASLNGRAESTISTAINLHYGAVLLFDRDIAAAYTLVVAGIEAMSRQFGSPPTDWDSWEDAERWTKFASRIELSESQWAELRKQLMKGRHLRLKETFVNYAASRLPETFWEEPWSEYVPGIDAASGRWTEGDWSDARPIGDFVSRDRNALAEALRKTYNARSGFVHSGDREVNLVQELFGLVGPFDPERPVPFAVLRSMLRTLIKTELEANSTHFELPPLVLTNNPPEGVSVGT